MDMSAAASRRATGLTPYPMRTSNPPDSGGGQIGYNYQVNNFVLGVEGEGTWADLNDNVSGCFYDATQSCSTKATGFATLTGRLGFTLDRALFYAKGGAAWGHFKYSNPAPNGPSPDYFARATRSGWTVGAGVEYALANNWSVKLEYDYLDFGAKNLTFTGTVDAFPQTITDPRADGEVRELLLFRFWRSGGGEVLIFATRCERKSPGIARGFFV